MSRPDSWLPDIDDTSCLRAEPTARCPAEGSPRCAHCAWTRVVVVPLPVRIPECDGLGCSCCSVVSALQSGYAESELHHNRHYGVSPGQPPACPDCARDGRVNSLGCHGCYQARKAYYQRVADNPCADHCSDPAAHAEGGHDV